MVEIRLLGQFAIHLDGNPIEMAARPAQSLFAYLALNAGIAQRRERLAGLLWPDSNEANARRNLRQALWQIRRALGPQSDTILRVDEMTITFNPQVDHQLDTATLARQESDDLGHADRSIERLMAALGGYVGDLLPGFYEDWVVLERERLQTVFEHKMNLLLDRLVTAGRWRDVLHWAEHWIALGHTPEPAYRALMQAHAAQGDISSVAEVYRRCVEALERDLAVEPSTQTQALYERLRRGETPPAAPAPTFRSLPTTPRHNLPSQLTSFVGRTQELATIQRFLVPTVSVSSPVGNQEQTARLLTLTGPGGAGKTRLALQAVMGLTDTFGDGIWLVELAQLADPDLLPQMLATVLAVREEPQYPLLRAVVDALRAKTLLLILDNCEHLVDVCAQVITAILRACPQVKILATSRETLGITGETVLRVPSLALPNLDPLPSVAQLVEYEAIRLFLDRAATVRPAFQLTSDNADAIAQICHQLDGIPLAIELAAARIQAMTAQQIAARLVDRFRLLTGGSRTALPRQQTLRATIDWSWDLLNDAERSLLRRLVVFLNGWTLEAAEAICAGDGLTESVILDLLTHLVEKSLVVVEEQNAAVRYGLLETIRQYAREKLLESNEAAAVRSRHLDYFVQFTGEAAAYLHTGEQLGWLARLDEEHDNLRSAITWAKSDDLGEAGLQLAGNLARFWYLRGYWKEGRAYLHSLLTATKRDQPFSSALAQARIKALHGISWLADEDGSEIPLYTESLALCRQIGDRWGEAFALRGLGAVNTNLGNLDVAALQLQTSLALFQEQEDEWGIALAHFNRGWLEFSYNNHTVAQMHWQAGLAGFQECGDRWGIAVTLGTLGYHARLRGDYEQAQTFIQASLANFQELGDQAGIAYSLLRLATLAFRRSDYTEAMALVQESLLLQREWGEQQGLYASLQMQGMVAGFQGQFGVAVAALEESLVLVRARGLDWEIADCLSDLGFILYYQNKLEQATVRFQESLALLQNGEANRVIAYATAGLGFVALTQGNYTQARDQLKVGLAFYRVKDDKGNIAMVLGGLGKVAQQENDPATALAHYHESLRLRLQIGDKHGIAESLERLATFSHCAEQSVQFLATAHALRQTIGAPILPVDQAIYAQQVNTLRTQLDETAFAQAWSAGQALSYEQAASNALGLDNTYRTYAVAWERRHPCRLPPGMAALPVRKS